MATIVLVQHLLQRYVEMSHPYVVLQFARRWREQGHRVIEHYGAGNPPAGDILFLHVDLTIVPPEYRALVPQYERCINGRILDISKRRFSQILVKRDDDWPGPVIIKTDRNHYGFPELTLITIARTIGTIVDIPGWVVPREYQVCASLKHVPGEVWDTPGLIVEKFVPERDEHGFYLRTWHFFGDQERNVRRRATGPFVKRENTVSREEAPVPDEIRAWRDRLGFDFGKFDYVVRDGRPILFDANRTPAGEPIGRSGPGGLTLLADGLNSFLR